MVVDDEEGPRQSVRIIFKDEYRVLVAKSGEEALELAKANLIAVVVTRYHDDRHQRHRVAEAD